MKNLFNMQRFLQVNLIGAIALTAAVLASSCNKDFPNTLRQEYPNDTLSAKGDERKVLYIILDGVRGQAVDSLKPTTLTQLARNSIFSYDGLVDAKSNTVTDAGAWTNMITGVTTDKHKVTSNDFAGNDLAAYPTLFSRLKSIDARNRTVSFASTAAFNDGLAADATVKQTLTSDEEVKTAVVNELKNNNAKLVVAQFHSAELAGANNAYLASNANYAQAITTLDTYIETMVSELKNRKTYDKENWLVVIASSKGGVIPRLNPSPDAFGDDMRNSFVIMHNPKFYRQSMAKPEVDALPYAGFAPRFISSPNSAAIAQLANTSVGNFGSSGEFTLMFKFRHDAASPLYYPVFFGKSNPFGDLNGSGWRFLFGANGFQLDWGGSPRQGGGDIRDGVWHTIGFTIRVINGTRTLTLYTDGVKKSSAGINGRNVDNTTGLRIGSDVDKATNFLLKDLAILNVGLSDADMATYMRKEVTPASPFFGNLLGWWKAGETSGNLLNDSSGKNNPFTMNASVNMASFEDLSPNISPEVSDATYRAVLNNIDIPVQIYQWMGISSISSWNLDGKAWRIQYTSVRN